jgi:YfiH family protein
MNGIVPDWPVAPHVHAFSTQRTGGVSVAPYASLNLASHVADAPAAVLENRRRLQSALLLPAPPQWLEQVHGVQVRDLDRDEDTVEPADACVTGLPGRVCAILTADCLPVLLASEAGDRVGAAHAGWRGLRAGVIEATVRALDRPPSVLMAWLGPAIGPAHFEIGPEVRDEMLQADPGAEAAFIANARGRFMADLYALARRRLKQVGVDRIYGGSACTYAEDERYFSHRRDGRTGRQASLIWLGARS